MKPISLQPRGFSLVEVLVTLVLVAIGILGLVALQARSVVFVQDSVQRNNAAILADDLIEIIRSADIVDSVTGLPPDSSDYYKSTGASFTSKADADCQTLPDAATDRLGCWALRASQRLPGVDVDGDLLKDYFYICRSSTPGSCSSTATGSALEIQLAWRAKKNECLKAPDQSTNGTTDTSNDASDICTYQLRTEL